MNLDVKEHRVHIKRQAPHAVIDETKAILLSETLVPSSLMAGER
jgi:hypothetical protein